MIVIVLPSISSTLDLSEWIRSGKQLDGQDASAIGLGMTTLFLQDLKILRMKNIIFLIDLIEIL